MWIMQLRCHLRGYNRAACTWAAVTTESPDWQPELIKTEIAVFLWKTERKLNRHGNSRTMTAVVTSLQKLLVSAWSVSLCGRYWNIWLAVAQFGQRVLMVTDSIAPYKYSYLFIYLFKDIGDVLISPTFWGWNIDIGKIDIGPPLKQT